MSAKYGGRSVLLREMILAFCENRMTIKPVQPIGEIYEPRN
jgi:hypothetical protein